MQDNELYRLDANDGRILTTYDMGSGGNFSWKSAVTADTVYAANGNGDTLFAFDKVTGAQKWTKTLSGTIQDPPFVASNGNIYVAHATLQVFYSGRNPCLSTGRDAPARLAQAGTRNFSRRFCRGCGRHLVPNKHA